MLRPTRMRPEAPDINRVSAELQSPCSAPASDQAIFCLFAIEFLQILRLSISVPGVIQYHVLKQPVF